MHRLSCPATKDLILVPWPGMEPTSLILVFQTKPFHLPLQSSKLSCLKSTWYFPLVFVCTMFLPQINFEIGPEIMWSHRKRGSITSAHLLSLCFLNAAYNSSPHLPNSKWLLEDSLGEGPGNPLQYSCLENPMDRGAWWGC